MKNIFLLPTDKPSRLMIDTIENKLYLQPILHEKTINVLTQHIYIKSSEEIKQGDWCLNANKDTIYKKDKYPMDISWDKIILTTDPTLIADGVQAIDGELLEWFVKNPTCEFVEVKLINDSENHPELIGNPIEKWSYYEIIIPQEEPKQETLEEAAENYEKIHGGSYSIGVGKAFKFGAKWQAERMYSLEQISKDFVGENGQSGYFDDWLDYRLDTKNKLSFKEWFEQKKK